MERKNRLQFCSVRTATMLLVATVAIIASLTGCSSTATTSNGDNQASSEASQTQESAETKAVYEAVFLDDEQISDLFVQARGGNAALAKVPNEYHITIAYRPESAHPEWYGQKVTVNITTYAMQEVKSDDGTLTENEGFKVELTSDNEQLNNYLTSLNENFHVTGSYKDYPICTKFIDFSEGQSFEATVTGTFGAYMTDGTVKLGA